MKNLLIVVVDCLGSDAVLHREKSAQTPSIDGLCDAGVTFPNAITAATFTTASFASLLTGLYPTSLGFTSQNAGYKLSDRHPYLPLALSRCGYDTAAFFTGPLVREIGFARGFKRFEHRDEADVTFGPWGRAFLQSFPGALREPWFACVHLWELHGPQRVAPECDSKAHGRTSYDRALSTVDMFMGDLLGKLDRQNTVVVVTGDHGEIVLDGWRARLRSATGPIVLRSGPLRRVLARLLRPSRFSSGYRRYTLAPHGHHVYDILARVPLIVSDGAKPGGGRVIPDQVRTIDVVPTVLDLIEPGGPKTMACQGRSVAPLMRGRQLDAQPAIVASHKDPWRWTARPLIGIRTPKWKLSFAVEDDTVPWELYDLESDPAEQNNVVSEFADVASDLHEQATQILRDGEQLECKGEELTPEEKETVEARLRSLGYL